MMKIAILGYGVVGSGVAKVIARCADEVGSRTGARLEVRKILDIRDFPGDPYEDLVVHDAAEVFDDPEIDLVVETIGGASFAYDCTRKALAAGKHVVTSNKELVSTHGPELLSLAAKNGVRYLYEASVGGGIPVIRPLHRDLAGNHIEAIAGIVNGTTNYILTQMKEHKKDFATALAEAQANGYAEQDPAADIDGADACRKLSILTSLVLGEHVPADQIHTEGIREISSSDTALADELGMELKLIASMRRQGDRLALIVAPHLVERGDPLAAARGVFNAIRVTGDSVGDVMFYGQGAGTWPTASAVVGDIIDIAADIRPDAPGEQWRPATGERVTPPDEAKVAAYLRCTGADVAGQAAGFREAGLPAAELVGEKGGETVLRMGTVEPTTEGELARAVKRLEDGGCQARVLRILV